MGIELSQKMLSDIMAFAQENPDVKVATIGGKKINIAEALSHYKPQNQPASVQDDKQNVISRQPYSYNNQQGVLIKYDKTINMMTKVKSKYLRLIILTVKLRQIPNIGIMGL